MDIKMIVSFTGESWCMFMHSEANKWEGLNAHFGISTAGILAFGDDYNDIEMLKNAGIGVAVGNAIDEVKAVADYICDTNDNDGVAKWVEENIA